MSYESIRHLLNIDVDELGKRLYQIPLNERGKIAESVAYEYSAISGGILTKSKNKSESSDSKSRICGELIAAFEGLKETFEISYPQTDLCLDVALKSYKVTHDINGMKRIGRILKSNIIGLQDFVDKATEDKRKDEVIYGASARLTSTGSFK